MSTRVDSASSVERAGAGASEAALSLFDGGGEMGARMRALDWSKTAVGLVETWPQSLKTAVRIMLTSRYAMWMGWGPDFTFFCNDAYLPTVGVKQSWVLGASARKVWAEIWDDIGPRAEAVINTGIATWDEGLLLFLERSGFPEETYHTFSYSPLPDDSGRIGGMLCVVTEETMRMLDERRLELLRELAAELAGTHTEPQVCDVMARILGAQLRDVPFTLTYLFDDSGRTARLACATGVAPDSPAAPSLLSVKDGDGPWPARSILMQGTQLIVDELASRCGPLPTGPWDKPPRQAVVMPLAQQGQGRPAGFLVLGINPYRPYDMAYRGFVSLLAGQVASGLANARAYEQERRRAEALAELDRAKTTFFSNVSHEFRTPLTLLLGPLEDALGDAVAGLPEVQRERLITAHNNSLRLLKLVNTLLDFSRIEAGRLMASYEPTELGAFTAELASNFRSASERVGLRLVVDCPPLSELVYVDRDMWEKVVLNLLSNAFKFTLKGEIRVLLRRVGELAELEVQDTGIGIAPSELPHLFERFYRVEGARGRSLEGTGIGLALAQELVKLHGGAISVKSTVNEGTTFTVTLPLGVAHLPPERVLARASGVAHSRDAAAYIGEAMRWLPADSSANAQAAPLSPLLANRPLLGAGAGRSDETRARILLADDNADMRDYVRRLLEAQYEVMTVTDGQAALHAALEQRPDLVLTDVMMPNLDGFGLLKALRADVRTAATPIILLSARAGEEARLEGHAAGADDYLIKPFSARELIARIGGALALARLRRQIVRREEELKAEKAMVLESIQEAFIAVDSSWCVNYVNAQAERICRETRAALVGRSLWDVFPGLGETGFGRLYRRTMAERVMLRTEEYYRPYACWFEVSGYPLSDGGVGIYFHDISERKRTEAIVAGQGQALELEINGASLERVLAVLTRIVESQSGEGVLAAILLLDPDGLHLRLGAAPSLPEAYGRAIDGIALDLSASAAASAPIVTGDLQIDPRWSRFRELAKEHGLCACWSTPLFSPQEKVLGIFVLYHREVRSAAASDREVVDILAPTAALVLERRMEVRERLAAEAALRDNEQRYRQLVHSLPAAVYTCDRRGYVTMYNEAAAMLWGHRPELGKQMWGGSARLYRPDGTALAQDELPMVVALRDGRPLSAVELIMERPDGSRRHVLAHPEPICDHGGQVTGALNIIVDITDRKRAEDALKEADRRKDEFLATLAHELRNPLAPIRSGLQLLRMAEGSVGENGGVNTERVYSMMERQVNHLVRLVDDLLEISRITRGKIDLRLEDVNLAAVLRSALDTSRPLIDAAEHELSVSLGDESLMVRADPVRLSQVIANLLNNAAKYTPKQGHIWLTVEPQEREVRIAVRDNGVGIPTDMLPRVFELFTQVDRTQKHSQGGLGIGLALVKSLVDMHHGRVEAHSDGLDYGSEFVVYLPLLMPQAQDAAERERAASGPAPEAGSERRLLPRMRIVVVDDSHDAADSLSMMLRLLGCEVRTAHDGPSGLRTIAQHRPNIVLLDIGMPGMDGYDVARRVRQREGLRDVVLIALTGWGQAEDRIQSKQAGFDHHLVKPVELTALQKLLTSIAAELRSP